MSYRNKLISNNTNMSKYTSFSNLALDDNDDFIIDDKPTEKIEIKEPEKKIYTKKITKTTNTDWKSIKQSEYEKTKYKNNKYNKNIKYNKTPIEEIPSDVEVIETFSSSDLSLDSGHEIKFQNIWNVWIHENDSKDWSIESYKIIHKITNIIEFWEFFNNIHKLNQWKYNFFVMKDNSHPTWEHVSNRLGGTCSIRIDINNSIDIIEQMSILLTNESLTTEINDINGISFAAKSNWCVIKIWNKNNKNNISTQMPSYLRKIYPAISIKYKENIPEY